MSMKKETFINEVRLLVLAVLIVLCLVAPAGTPLAVVTGTITAEAASTSVKQLAKGESFTISGYSKVKSSKSTVAVSVKTSSKKYTIQAKKKGTVTLKCYDSSNKLTKRIYLIVTNSSSFKYNTEAITLIKGETKTVKATVQDGCTVKYKSSKKDVATVNSKGKITAKEAGTTTISAKVYYKGKLIETMKKKVTVKASTTPASSSCTSSSSNTDNSASSFTPNTEIPELTVEYDSSDLTLILGRYKNVPASVTSGYTVSYTSLDTSVATVSTEGKITGVSGGTTAIKVEIYYNGSVKEILTKNITVVYPEYTLDARTDTAYISLGGSVSNTADIYFSNERCNYWLIYESSDTAVATTAENGGIIAVSPGTATITGLLKLGIDESNAKVVETWQRKVVVTENSLNYNELILYMDGNSSDTLICQNLNWTDAIEWSCSDSSVIKTYSTVYGERVVIALKEGTATVTCKVNSCTTLTCKVTVTNKYSYDVYLVNSNEIYSSDSTGCTYCFYIKTDNPSVNSLQFRGNSILTVLDVYDDIPSVKNAATANFYPVTGGYIYSAQFKQSGNQEVSLLIDSNTVKTFNVNVFDYTTARNEWIDWLIDNYTTNSMTSFEKMESICKYLKSSSSGFKYPANDGTSFLTLSTETGPVFIKKVWDSASSPAMLTHIAERIGGFDYIHDCYYDYAYGSDAWSASHYYCAVGVGDTVKYYEVCPSWSSGTITSITYVDLNTTKNLMYIG